MLFDCLQTPGNEVYIETFGKYYTGRVVKTTQTTVTLDRAAWVADCGRYTAFLAGEPENHEVEVYPDDFKIEVPVSYIAMAAKWPYGLFREQV